MRRTIASFIAMAGWLVPFADSGAELQNTTVGGSLRIRGNWWSQGDLDFNKDVGNDALYIEQRTRVNILAEFTDDVRAYVEIDHYGNWGDHFRGLDSELLLTGADGTSNTLDSYFSVRGIPSAENDNFVNLYQAYIETKDAWGAPIDIKIGRSEMQHGDEFLVGNNDEGPTFRGLSFDGIWLTYRAEPFALTGFWTRLATENTPPIESSGDTNFSGLYASYSGIESMTIDGYYYFFHQSPTDETRALGFENATAFHTVGMRFAGEAAGMDWSADAAGQFGDSGGPNRGDMATYGGQATVGYKFEVATQPRLFVNGAIFGGDEKEPEDHNFFNRLFSDHKYSEIIDRTDLSNFWMAGGGMGIQPTEKITLDAAVNWFRSIAHFEDSGLGEDRDLGLEVSVHARYEYSENLSFRVGYARFLAAGGMEDSARNASWAFARLGGIGQSDDIDYAYLETGLRF